MVLYSVIYMVKVFIKNTLLVKGGLYLVPHGSRDKLAQAQKACRENNSLDSSIYSPRLCVLWIRNQKARFL